MELWQLYDDEGNQTERVIKRGEKIPDGYHFHCIEAWIVNEKKEVLLTKRHPDKPSYPLYWEPTGGGVVKGEDSKDAAIREVLEETGISIAEKDFYYMGRSMGDTYMIDTYIYILRGDPYPKLKLQEEEVVGYQWISIDELDMVDKIMKEKVTRFLDYFPKIKKNCCFHS